MSRRTRLSPAPSRWRRLLTAVVISAVATTGVVFGLSTPASAHGQFVSSDPAKDAEVSMALASILLYFTEKPTSNAYFAVTTPSGVRVDRLWSHGSPRRLGNEGSGAKHFVSVTYVKLERGGLPGQHRWVNHFPAAGKWQSAINCQSIKVRRWLQG